MTFEEFKNEVLKGIKEYPSNWRYGQKVFNYIDTKYNLARKIQFEHHVDCFYNDDLVDEFLKIAYMILI